jgi:hypothetical protein
MVARKNSREAVGGSRRRQRRRHLRATSKAYTLDRLKRAAAGLPIT